MSIELMKDWFNKVNVEYGESGLTEIHNVCHTQKTTLRDLFSKHSKWDKENERIELKFEEDISYNQYAHDRFISFIRDTELVPDEIISIIRCYYHKDFGHITDAQFDVFKQFGFKFRPNSRTNKSLNNICKHFKVDENDEYNEQFRVYSEACGAKPKEQTMYVTIADVDFLTMSYGDSWSSCFAPNDELDPSYSGMHREGVLSYALDNVSFIVQVVDDNADDKDERIRKLNKRMHCAYRDGKLLTSLVYPNNGNERLSKQMRHIVQDIIAECLGVESNWVKLANNKKTDIFIRGVGDIVGYPDWIENGSSLTAASVLKDKYDVDSNYQTVSVGAEPICIYCGEEYHSDRTLYCSSCR